MSGSGAPGGLPLDATITIVNNSGKIISTGKQLLSIWKTAQASYREKKTELNQERAQERAAAADKRPPPVPVKRAQTFDTSRTIPRRQYDELSLALTEGNLEKLSEVSSVAPSKPPSAYKGSYAADAPEGLDFPEGHVEDEREQAEQLIHKIENLLDEAHCAQHSATAIITHLQERPDAAAAVALTLAELSGIITKLSPGFAAILKGTSPAIFALLASSQFLIGTGIAVGVTVVMFGGWKIVQRTFAKKAVAYEGAAAAPAAAVPRLEEPVDEAIVLETVEVDISGIDTWRRGIVDWGYESADQELMTPEADRVVRERRASKGGPEDYFDSKSRRSSKPHRSSSKAHSSSHSSSSHKSHKSRHERESSSSDKKSSSSSSSSSSGSKKDKDDSSSVNSMSLIKKSIASRKKALDESGVKSEELPLRAKMRQTNMLKALFKSKEHRQTLIT
ncbi:hypothetical protein BBK36DRAFT_1202087 [Trichoderma citrinoviride]|uniref:Uncharacterized protein n=1 Tax=Trichoderma citrinoviride TaxID=58853 RepID=A0A2T4B8N2_9HYPO|nr:hypothetical protein BBK36DRAFT_1202087 [Trichoderma citrinoviride]PTB65571.1 hypothetical protein BBK36DRAFT_1202087 [Trichoderma citrinoviride]